MKTAKKIYVENAKLLDEILKIETDATGKTLSSLIEDHIISSILRNSRSRHYAKLMVSEGLEKALVAIYEFVSEHIAGNSSYENIKEMVIFSKNLYRNYQPGNVGVIQQLSILNHINSLYTRVDSWVKENTPNEESDIRDIQKYNDYKSLAEWIKNIAGLYEGNFNLFNPVDIFSNIVLRGWELFHDWETTYSLLAEIQSLTEETVYPSEIKWEFIQILNEITEEWDE